MDAKIKVFDREDNRGFGIIQNLTLGEADFIQFLRLRSQRVIAPKKLVESKIRCQGSNQQCQKTGMKNSDWFTI